MMGYHSDTLAFKKSELLAVLQAIDESFSFDTVVSNQQKIQKTRQSSRQDFGDYKTLLFKKPLLSSWDAASIISDTNPVLLSDLNEYEAGREYPNWIGALSFISSSISAGLLEQNNFSINGIKRDDLKAFLASQDIFVDGFNDNLSTQEPIGCGHPTIQQTVPNIENLNAEIARLRNLVADQTTEIQDLKSKIQELETQPTIQNDESNLIDPTPEQEIPNTRQRNNVLRIIAVLVDMAGLPNEPFTAFNILEAHAQSKGMELPSKDTTTKWTHNSS